MEIVSFIGGSLHGTLREMEHTAARINFPKETYIAVIDNVYILESLHRELDARKRLLSDYTIPKWRNTTGKKCAAYWNHYTGNLTQETGYTRAEFRGYQTTKSEKTMTHPQRQLKTRR